MQTKTIRKKIEEKMTDWLNTIPDLDLREDVRLNLLVSGGCIASMFLGEKVNDFDVYISNPVVLYLIAKHYRPDNCQMVVNQSLADPGYYTQENFFSKNELDREYVQKNGLRFLFTDSSEQSERSFTIEKKDEGKYKPVFISPNAITLDGGIQIILRFCGTPRDITGKFDFVHATNYFSFKEGLVTNIKALEAILSKRLIYQGSDYPIASLIRMKKFLKRGWDINAGDILKISYQCSGLDLSAPNVLRDQTIGVDISYFNSFLKLLSGDEKDINFEYLKDVIDRVWDK